MTGTNRSAQFRLRDMAWKALCTRFGFHGIENDDLAALNKRLDTYPENHTYRVLAGKLHACWKLRSRWRRLSRAYPARAHTFLDVGSCKGYFVLRQAMQPVCQRAVGIDAVAAFVDVANDVARRVGLESKAQFKRMTLDEAAGAVEVIGGPFDFVQMISTYHYIYWGSRLCDARTMAHEPIMAHLARLCRGAVLFASPLCVNEAPEYIRECANGRSHNYSQEAFLNAAGRHFQVYRLGYLQPVRRRRPILLMVRNTNPETQVWFDGGTKAERLK